eukprot:920517-Pleurochrysis_carterae.AAC.1
MHADTKGSGGWVATLMSIRAGAHHRRAGLKSTQKWRVRACQGHYCSPNQNFQQICKIADRK